MYMYEHFTNITKYQGYSNLPVPLWCPYATQQHGTLVRDHGGGVSLTVSGGES